MGGADRLDPAPLMPRKPKPARELYRMQPGTE